MSQILNQNLSSKSGYCWSGIIDHLHHHQSFAKLGSDQWSSIIFINHLQIWRCVDLAPPSLPLLPSPIQMFSKCFECFKTTERVKTSKGNGGQQRDAVRGQVEILFGWWRIRLEKNDLGRPTISPRLEVFEVGDWKFLGGNLMALKPGTVTCDHTNQLFGSSWLAQAGTSRDWFCRKITRK